MPQLFKMSINFLQRMIFLFTVDSWTISARIAELLEDCMLARNTGRLLQSRLDELTRQLTIAQGRCLMKERVLCDTLALNSNFSVAFFVDEVIIKKNS